MNFEAATEGCVQRKDAGPFFGWLSNRFPHYPETLNLKTNVHVRQRMRTAVELEPTDHPLAIEQREGISMERLQRIVSVVMHSSA